MAIQRTLIVVPEALLDTANVLAQQLSGNPADGVTFGAAQYGPTHSGPASHYVCSVALDGPHRAELAQLQPQYPQITVADYDLETQGEAPTQTFASLGIVPLCDGALPGGP